jgi:TolA-binding protein
MTAANRDATEKRDAATLTTIAEVAKACGVSKSTAARRLKELDLATVSDPSDRRGRQLLPPATASALAAALMPTDGSAPENPEAARGLLEAQVEPYRDQIAALEREVERLTDQIANRDAAAVEAVAQAEQRIEDLKRENAQLREDLALSRRLEGFHWPWTRDRIKAQHLLPKSTE